MDRLVPITVTPKPDTTIRVFLDWIPLSDNPKVQPHPQRLSAPKRTGFTYVEWGGLQWQGM